jgi:hypothetical protein
MVTLPKVAPFPPHPLKKYPAAKVCVYCGTREKLTDEHIVPFAAGGAWLLPQASCKACAAITGKFEGEFGRTIIGPLRMLFNMPTRRPKERPRHLPLKVKYPGSTDWEIAKVDRRICPFLVVLPLYPMPELMTGQRESGERTSATNKLWIRGGGFWPDRDAHLQWLCMKLGAVSVMPTGTAHTEPYCLTILKVAHSFANAELGVGGFEPLLPEMILKRDLRDRAMVLGGGSGDEPPSSEAHEVTFVEHSPDHTLIVVRVRLFSSLGAPSHHVVVGRRL